MSEKKTRNTQRYNPKRPEKLKAVSFDDMAKTIAKALSQITGEQYRADILRANYDSLGLGRRTNLNGPAEITLAIALEEEQ